MFEAGAFLGHFSYLLAKVYCNLDLEENLENLTLEIILRREFLLIIKHMPFYALIYKGKQGRHDQ